MTDSCTCRICKKAFTPRRPRVVLPINTQRCPHCNALLDLSDDVFNSGISEDYNSVVEDRKQKELVDLAAQNEALKHEIERRDEKEHMTRAAWTGMIVILVGSFLLMFIIDSCISGIRRILD